VFENGIIVTAQALKSCGKSHRNERLKRKALRLLRKTDIAYRRCGRDIMCFSFRLLLVFVVILRSE